MVLDSKALEWASQQGLDTATLKKAKVPIYGKWYFPDLPAGVPLVNLQTGAVETFEPGFRAGAVLYVKEEDLKRAGLGPYKAAAAPPAPAPAGAAAPTPPTETTTPAETADAVTAAAPVQPSAVPGTPAADAQQPVRMLHHEDEGGYDGGHAAAHVAHAAPVVEEHHPSPRTYVNVAIILAIITAVEVAVYYVEALAALLVPILLVLSAAKFSAVVGYFMHLKFDHKMYTGLFAGGLAVALSVFAAVIVLFYSAHSYVGPTTNPGGGASTVTGGH